MNLPASFIESLRENFPNEVETIILSLTSDSPTSIRINRNKIRFDAANCVKWCESGYYLSQRPAFTFDPLFHAGAYYVQEASSMFLEQVIKQYAPNDAFVLDLCAAPGGKTTLALANLSPNAFVVANEIVRSRAYVLSENLAKTGQDNYLVLNSDAQHIGQLPQCFDLIITDVPCSGEGMFRKDPNAIEEWSEDNVHKCVSRQKEILQNSWNSLKPNGILVYSTCTYNKHENEAQIAWLCTSFGAESLIVDHDFEGITASLDSSIHAYRFFPHKITGEGFFLSVVRKSNQPNCSQTNSQKFKKKSILSKEKCPEQCKQWLKDSDNYSFEVKDNEVYAIRKTFLDQIHLIEKIASPLYKSLHLATIKGKDTIPTHELALSLSINNDAFPRYELDYNQAISYLKKEAITVSDECPLGYIIVTFCYLPLGFVKNMGNRCNNLYPSEWRIRTQHSPTAFWTVLSDRQP